MEWLNIHRADIESPEFVGAEPIDRATWLCLFAFCAGQENGGVILSCSDWGDRKWQQIARITLREVKRQCDLWSWDGPNLVVKFYPIEKEREIQAKRKAGKDRAALRWGNSANTVQVAPPPASSSADSSATSSADSSENSTPTPELDAEGKGREGKEREGKKEEAADAAGSDELIPPCPPYPPALNTPEFAAAWADWLAYRRERKLATYKPRSQAAQLAELAEWGHDAAIASIRESIRQQWQGLFAPKSGPGGAPRSGPVPWQRRTAEIDHGKGF